LTQKAAGAQGAPEEGFAIQQVRECWEKIANAGAVNLWLSGHTHRFAHLAPAGQSGRSSATSRATDSKGGRGAPGNPNATAAHNRYHLVIGAPDTFTRVDVSPTGLMVTVTRETGETLKTIEIR
jgi:hypothetical protein